MTVASTSSESITQTHAVTVAQHAALLAKVHPDDLMRVMSPQSLEEMDRLLVTTIKDLRQGLTGTSDRDEAAVSDLSALRSHVALRAPWTGKR